MVRDRVSDSPDTTWVKPLIMFSKGRIATLKTSSKKPRNFLYRTLGLAKLLIGEARPSHCSLYVSFGTSLMFYVKLSVQ